MVVMCTQLYVHLSLFVTVGQVEALQSQLEKLKALHGAIATQCKHTLSGFSSVTRSFGEAINGCDSRLNTGLGSSVNQVRRIIRMIITIVTLPCAVFVCGWLFCALLVILCLVLPFAAWSHWWLYVIPVANPAHPAAAGS